MRKVIEWYLGLHSLFTWEFYHFSIWGKKKKLLCEPKARIILCLLSGERYRGRMEHKGPKVSLQKFVHSRICYFAGRHRGMCGIIIIPLEKLVKVGSVFLVYI